MNAEQAMPGNPQPLRNFTSAPTQWPGACIWSLAQETKPMQRVLNHHATAIIHRIHLRVLNHIKKHTETR